MARPSQASASSNPKKTGRTRQAAKEIEVVAVEAADAPTQRVVSRRPNTKTSPQTPKTPSGPAKKRTSRSAPQELPEEEVEAEDDHTSPEPPPSGKRGAPKKKPRMTKKEKEMEKFREELNHMVEKAQKHPWARKMIKTVFPTAEPSTMNVSHVEEGEEEQTTPVKHFKKDKIERKKPNPWTEDHEEFLVNLICEQGAKWALFERLYSDGKLFGRNQTALKDKARNIMRKIIDSDQEEEWLKKYPLWAQVTVGQARRGVHGYQSGEIPARPVKRSYTEMAQ